MGHRITICTSLLLIFALVLPACGGNGTGRSSGGNRTGRQSLIAGNRYIDCPVHTNTGVAAPEQGTVALTVSGWTSTPAEDTLVQQNLRNFEVSHPGIKINWSPIPGDYLTKMRANVASGTVPDVFYLQPAMSSAYISAGKLLNLSPYMAHDGMKASSYYPALLSPFTCANGDIFGLPKDWNSLGVFYNRRMFQAVGLPVPGAKWTWSDFQNAARRLTQNAGTRHSIYGVVLSAELSRWGAFLLQAGGSVLNEEGDQAVFNNQAGIKALQFYNSFFKKKTGAMPTTVGAPWNGDAFGKGRAAMVIEGGWLIPYLASVYPQVEYGIAPLPVDINGKAANLSFTNAWSASASTGHPVAAWELIKYMTGASVQESQLRAGLALPTLQSLANSSYFATHPDFKVLFGAAPYSTADYYGPQDATIHTDLNNAIQEVLLNRQTIQTALNNAATQINNRLQGG